MLVVETGGDVAIVPKCVWMGLWGQGFVVSVTGAILFVAASGRVRGSRTTNRESWGLAEAPTKQDRPTLPQIFSALRAAALSGNLGGSNDRQKKKKKNDSIFRPVRDDSAAMRPHRSVEENSSGAVGPRPKNRSSWRRRKAQEDEVII